ncbi:MAG: acyl-CoA thioesterase [Verrucomicrobia bacterium]|nr:MAG: acyl-CoA thioesterase [Verrucomicrobiota bacterium]
MQTPITTILQKLFHTLIHYSNIYYSNFCFSDKIRFDSAINFSHFHHNMIESQTQIRVRYVETDAMGFVHHSNFIPWLELARVEMMDNVGLPYINLEKEGVLMPVLEIHIKLLSPAYFDDRITIKLQINEPPKVRLKVAYQIFRDTTLIATAETLHTFINRSGKPIKPPKNFLDTLNAYF